MKKISAIGFALLMVFAVFVPVVSALNDPTKEGYQSVVNPNVLGERSPENIGHLDVLLACRAPQIGGEFTIVPVTVSAPFTNAARVDKAFVDQFVKQFGEPETKQYLPDGTFDGNFAPGTYLLKQVDGNGGQPEFALVAIKAADSQTVVFLGHGISGVTEEKKVVITVTEATYGAQRTVVDEPAHEHTIVDHEAYYEHSHDHATVEVPCVHNHPAEYRTGYPYTGPGHVHANQVGGTADSQNRFVYNGQVYEINQGNGGQGFFVTGTYHAAYNEHTHDHATVEVPCEHFHPACTHVVHHPAVTHTEGTFVDVKAEVQALLDGGQQTMKFDNAQNPGGIFDAANNLMKQIADPAYGQVKSVHIVYTVDGGAPKTVDKQEYQVFTLE